MELIPQIVAVISVVLGAGGVAVFLREWLWLRFCRYVHDQAVERGHNPKPEVIIQAAREGRLGGSPKQRQLTAPPKQDNKSLAA